MDEQTTGMSNATNYRPGAGRMDHQGLAHTLGQRVIYPLLELRNHDGAQNRVGQDMSLEYYMQTVLGLKNGHGEPLGWADLWLMMGENPYQTSLKNLIERPDDFRFLAGEAIREFVIEGLNILQEEAWYRHFCVSTDDKAPAMTIHQPSLKFHDATTEQIAEAETLPLSRITMADKSIRLTTKGVFMEWTDQVKYSSPLPLLKIYFQQVAMEVLCQENDHCVYTMINGDQAILGSASDAVGVIGVASTENGLTFDADCLPMWSHGRRLNVRWDSIVTSEAASNKLYLIDEFKPNAYTAAPIVTIESRNRVIPSSMPHCISPVMEDGFYLFVDPRQNMRHLALWPIRVEEARYPEKLVSGVGINTCTGYERIRREACVMVDEATAFSATGWPAHLTPRTVKFYPPASAG